MKVNLERIKNNLNEINNIKNHELCGYTRIAHSIEEKEALKWIEDKVSKLPMLTKQDKIGNFFSRYGDSHKKAIAIGSHIDTVSEGGFFDGSLGVIISLECIQTLIENNYNPNDNVPIELIGFIAEESNPLGGTFGSRALAGLLSFSSNYEEKLKEFGYSWDDVVSSKQTSDSYHYFLETHIEQGPLLEYNNKSIGVVTSITGMIKLSVLIHGLANHAGTTPIHLREDALVKTAGLIQKINELAALEDNIVATVGKMSIEPNASNIIPGKVYLTLDIRGKTSEEMNKFKNHIIEWSKKNINANFSIIDKKQPSLMSKEVYECTEKACQKRNISFQKIFSGAGHDARSMSNITKSGMIFIPSKDGISHRYDEFSSWEQIETGANITLNTIEILIKLASQNAKNF